ncbi:MAG TPA: class I SAM-dependent methyltransferase [Pyrinomonadaceae bacterium]|nr:class I SAM-dependent methyltransferase [Pyrinomonadaceae bacterium]
MAVPDRYRWAVDILDVQPSDVILEIGCGYGHSIPLICEKLDDGHLTAIDGSEKMVAAATRSNEEFVATDRAEILHLDLIDSAFPSSAFDKIFLFNINIFWMDPVAELAEIRRLLKPQGWFFLFHQPPPGHDLDEFEAAFRTNLVKHDFLVLSVFKDQSEAVRSVALIAKPSLQ